MRKPHVDGINEPLRWICNEAFYGVKKRLPKRWQRNEVKLDKRLAKTFGLLSGYGASCIGKSLIYPVIQQVANNHGIDIPLEQVAGYGLMATVAAGFIPRLVAPDYVRRWEVSHPTYSSGVNGVMTGASLKALVELLK